MKKIFTLVLVTFALAVSAQTNPTPQSLPYIENFSALTSTDTVYPAGWQGWNLSGAGSADSFRTTVPIADESMMAPSTASNTSGGIHNYDGTIGFLQTTSKDASLCLAISTTGKSNIQVDYDIMTLRNPYNGSSNTRINEATLQYRVGTTGNFTTLTGIEYQNNTITQTSGNTGQKIETKSITLPSACDNQAVVQLRWVGREISGSGSRPSFALDNIYVQEGGCNTTAGFTADADTICAGGTVNFTNTSANGVSYLWKENGVQFATSANASRTFNTAGSYTIRLVAINGICYDSTEQTVVVNALPNTSSITGTSSVCDNQAGVSYSVTNTAGSTYAWTAPSGASITAGQGTNSITVTFGTASGNVTVTETNVKGCTGTQKTLSVTVNATAAASVSIGVSPNDTVCAGTSVTFTATPVNGGSSPAYQWKLNGGNVGTNSSNYSNSSLSDGDQVSCIMTSALTCATGSPATSNTITMKVSATVTPSVSIAVSPNDTVCAGTSVTFTATPVNGGSSPSYQWKKNSTNVGTNSTTYTNASLADGDTIICVMTSNATCASPNPVTSNAIKMKVNATVTASVTISASADTICSGDNVTFNATPVNGGSSPSYQWKKNGTNVGTNSATYTNSSLADGDRITCRMTSNAACVTGSPAFSDTITMQVNPLPVADAGNNVTINAGDSTQLNASGGATYSWTPATGLSNANIANPFAKPSSTTKYFVMVTDTNGCTDTDSVTVTVIPTGIHEFTAGDLPFTVYPNPFRQQAQITYTLNERARVSLEVYNLLGRKIALAVNEIQSAGKHRYLISNKELSFKGGVYMLKLTMNEKTIVKKLVLAE